MVCSYKMICIQFETPRSKLKTRALIVSFLPTIHFAREWHSKSKQFLLFVTRYHRSIFFTFIKFLEKAILWSVKRLPFSMLSAVKYFYLFAFSPYQQHHHHHHNLFIFNAQYHKKNISKDYKEIIASFTHFNPLFHLNKKFLCLKMKVVLNFLKSFKFRYIGFFVNWKTHAFSSSSKVVSFLQTIFDF